MKKLIVLALLVAIVVLTEPAWYWPVVHWQPAAALFLPAPRS